MQLRRPAASGEQRHLDGTIMSRHPERSRGIPAFVFAFLVVILVEDLLLSLPVLKVTHKPEGQRPDLSQPRVNRGPRRTFFVRWGGETLGLWPPINQRAESPT